MEILWKPVLGYEGKYEISNTGIVKSLNYKNTGMTKLMSNQISKMGYVSVKLSLNGKNKRYKLHRLMAIAFLINSEDKPFVNHINGNKKDNRLENLEWCTAKENVNHADKTGLRNIALGDSIHSKAIYQYSKDGIFIKEWSCLKDASDNLKICKTTISLVCSGKFKRKTAGGFIFRYKYEYIKIERTPEESIKDFNYD